MVHSSSPAGTKQTVKRMAYLILGFVALGLGIIGAFVPLMPTTCFILAAAWAFARSSDRWHQALRNHVRFGATVRDWEDHRCMSRRAKRIAIGSIVLTFSLSLLLWRQSTVLTVLLVLLMAALIGYIWTRAELPQPED